MPDLTLLFNQLLEGVTRFRGVLLFAACAGLGAAGALLIAGMPFR